MTDINTGGAAFPCEGGSDSGIFADPGMSLRDYFASMALQGFLASQYVSDFIKEVGKFSTDADVRRNLATNAYLYADAMIAAREVQP
ncbi:hypothetical protein F9K94_15505 [Brucella tritici]|uniref:Uncharacterized protein n=1 Tax=Brucella tritici TaxID=94626 RepID=A0A7V8B1L1_9HYPH|nr:hypothetical protein [Brucella tritici]KAB2655931.1 hypothetical protein F9K94_15505 [Brucella tritici]